MVGGGQLSLHTPLSLKWRQACKEVELLKVHEKKNTKQNQTKPNQDSSYVTYQTVGVFGSGASSSTLHVAAVFGKRAFASLAARRTVTTGHFEGKRQAQTFSCSLTKQSFCLQATGTHRSGSPVQLLPNSLSNTQRNSWGLQQQEKHNT